MERNIIRFVNGQHTTQGGTHLSAFKESIGRVIKEYYNKNFEYSDIRAGIVAAISIKVEELYSRARQRPSSARKI